jgi:hypothetical protein
MTCCHCTLGTEKTRDGYGHKRYEVRERGYSPVKGKEEEKGRSWAQKEKRPWPPRFQFMDTSVPEAE